MTVTFTEKELDFLDRCLTRARIAAEQAAAAFRLEPVAENIAQSYDAEAAAVDALLARIRAAGRS